MKREKTAEHPIHSRKNKQKTAISAQINPTRKSYIGYLLNKFTNLFCERKYSHYFFEWTNCFCKNNFPTLKTWPFKLNSFTRFWYNELVFKRKGGHTLNHLMHSFKKSITLLRMNLSNEEINLGQELIVVFRI